MTIEFSLRRRATQSRCLAIVWLGVVVVILVGTYISFPFIANKTLNFIVQIQTTIGSTSLPFDAHLIIFAGIALVLELLSIMFACFLLSRSAFVEIELAARFMGLADALCMAGDNLEDFEKAANLLVPKSRYLSIPEIVSLTDIKSIAELVKPSR